MPPFENPGLLAVEDPAVAVATGRSWRWRRRQSPTSASVRAKAAMAVPARVLREPGARVARRSEQRNRTGAKALHGEREVGKPVMARQSLARQRQSAHVEARSPSSAPAPWLQPAVAPKARLPARGRRHRHRDDRRRERFGAPSVEPARIGHDDARLEERPVEETRVGLAVASVPREPRLGLARRTRRRRGGSRASACRSPAPALRPRSPGRASSTIPD